MISAENLKLISFGSSTISQERDSLNPPNEASGALRGILPEGLSKQARSPLKIIQKNHTSSLL